MASIERQNKFPLGNSMLVVEYCSDVRRSLLSSSTHGSKNLEFQFASQAQHADGETLKIGFSLSHKNQARR
jgi:hypothetical protein